MSMKNKKMAIIIGIIFILGLLLNAEETKEVSYKKLSKSVQTKLTSLISKSEITKVERVIEEEAIKYEIESVKKGISKDITLSESGDILEIETGTKLSELPKTSIKEIKKEFPEIKFKKIESVQVFYYSIEAEVNGKPVDFIVTATGDIENSNDEENEKNNAKKDNKKETEDED